MRVSPASENPGFACQDRDVKSTDDIVKPGGIAVHRKPPAQAMNPVALIPASFVLPPIGR